MIQPKMYQDRCTARRRTFLGGKLIYGDGLSTDCVVRNHSAAGAMLELPTGPDTRRCPTIGASERHRIRRDGDLAALSAGRPLISWRMRSSRDRSAEPARTEANMAQYSPIIDLGSPLHSSGYVQKQGEVLNSVY
jgi:hypothetical protein